MRAVILGDSQGQGLQPVIGAVLARHGYTLDTSKSWTDSGASLATITSHATGIGPADLVLVVSGGGNDGSLVTSPTYAGKLADLVSSLRAQGVAQVIWIGPMRSDDPAVAAQHDAARAVQRAGIPGARWIDGDRLSAFVPHPAGNPTHWDRNGYAQIAQNLELAVFESGLATGLGLVGTLAFLGAAGVVVMELLYAKAAEPD